MTISSKLSVGFLAIVISTAIFAPWVAPYSYETQDTLNTLATPNTKHWMVFDRLGRDLLSRIIYGARVSLLV
jgi:ABC-type dipeptide/oligopeptide/nickel transport system permease subunit